MAYQTILITGASTGIGSALAIAFSSQQTTLLLLARDIKKLEKTASECRQKGSKAICISQDITDLEQTRKVIADLDNKHSIDLLIANAGVTSSIGHNGEPESWSSIKKVIDTNLYGVLATLDPLIHAMKERKQGHLVLISSLAAYRGMPITPAYSASKAGVKAYGEALSGWLKHDNINVTVVCPGFVKSDMSDHFPGNKPFMIDQHKAALIIKKGVTQKRKLISFPFPLNLGTRLHSLLPGTIADWLFEIMSYGGRRK